MANHKPALSPKQIRERAIKEKQGKTVDGEDMLRAIRAFGREKDQKAFDRRLAGERNELPTDFIEIDLDL